MQLIDLALTVVIDNVKSENRRINEVHQVKTYLMTCDITTEKATIREKHHCIDVYLVRSIIKNC